MKHDLNAFAKAACVGMFLVLGATCAWAEQVEISGSTTVQKQIIEPSVAGIKSALGIDLKYNGIGSGNGVAAYLGGKGQAAAISESLEDVQASLHKSKPDLNTSGLKFYEIMADTIVVVANKENSVASLSKQQVVDIFTGKIKNWKEVGGKDMPIVVIAGGKGSGTRSAWQKLMLGDQEYVAGAVELRTTKDEVAAVAKEPGAIGAVGDVMLNGSIKEIKGANVSRPLGFVVKGEPSGDLKKIIDFLHSAEGKKLYVGK